MTSSRLFFFILEFLTLIQFVSQWCALDFGQEEGHDQRRVMRWWLWSASSRLFDKLVLSSWYVSVWSHLFCCRKTDCCSRVKCFSHKVVNLFPSFLSSSSPHHLFNCVLYAWCKRVRPSLNRRWLCLTRASEGRKKDQGSSWSDPQYFFSQNNLIPDSPCVCDALSLF